MDDSYVVGASGRIALVRAGERRLFEGAGEHGADVDEDELVVGFFGSVNDDEPTVFVPVSRLGLAKEAFRRGEALDAESDVIDTAVVARLYGTNGDTYLQYPSVDEEEERQCLMCEEAMSPSTAFITFEHPHPETERENVAFHQDCLSDAVDALDKAASRADVLLGQEL